MRVSHTLSKALGMSTLFQPSCGVHMTHRYDFVPDVLSRAPGDIDEWIKTDDEQAFLAARRLIHTEGLLVGGSSGSALAGALQWLKTKEGWERVGSVQGANVVVLLPDG